MTFKICLSHSAFYCQMLTVALNTSPIYWTVNTWLVRSKYYLKMKIALCYVYAYCIKLIVKPLPQIRSIVCVLQRTSSILTSLWRFSFSSLFMTVLSCNIILLLLSDPRCCCWLTISARRRCKGSIIHRDILRYTVVILFSSWKEGERNRWKVIVLLSWKR